KIAWQRVYGWVPALSFGLLRH
ncbi:MAG: hypothetical protein QOH33_475, partial [Paraburkholderia sp.]|nr:hypothetical protein [Paraburkholderia sp.]